MSPASQPDRALSKLAGGVAATHDPFDEPVMVFCSVRLGALVVVTTPAASAVTTATVFWYASCARFRRLSASPKGRVVAVTVNSRSTTRPACCPT